MKTITLSDEQASTLVCYILLTTKYREDEIKACQRLAQLKNEDGTPAYLNMASNAKWWENAHNELELIRKTIEESPYIKEVHKGER